MSNDSQSKSIPTGDLLSIGAESGSPRPNVRLRPREDKVNRRSKGIVFGDDFHVTAEQQEIDQDLVKQAYSEAGNIASMSAVDGSSRSKDVDAALKDEYVITDISQAANPIPSLEDIEKEFFDIAHFKVFQLAGDDVMGRPVIAFSACRLPVRELIDHQRLLKFAKATLDHYVVNDYTLVYFHYGLNSQNKPSLSWLLQVYKELDRKYKKNIKAFYIIHPSNFIKVAYAIMSPFLSKKFGKKIHNINRLDDLAPYIRLGQLDIPKDVRNHDEQLIAKSKAKPQSSTTSSFYVTPEIPKTQQFGVSLKLLIENGCADPIPVVIKTCVSFLRQHGLTTEGIFRRSPLSSTVETLKKEFNNGIDVQLDPNDVHSPAVLIKKFLREMPEPLLTFEFYDVAIDLCTLQHPERVLKMREKLKECLPFENYALLVYIVTFLEEVVENSGQNKMSTGNLAIIFGPNLMWSKIDTTSLTTMAKINTFTKALLDNSKEILQDRAIYD
eukprot:gene8615-9545_t